MKNGERTPSRVEILEAALASGIGQAIAGWAAEFTHRLLESDPELRKQLRRNWLLMHERIVQITGESQMAPRRHRTRPRHRSQVARRP